MVDVQKMYHCVLNTLSNILIMNVMWNTTWIQHRKRTSWCGTSCIHNTRKSNKTVSHANFYSPWMVSSESLLTSYKRIASSSSICVEIVHGSPKNKDWNKQLLKIKFILNLTWNGWQGFRFWNGCLFRLVGLGVKLSILKSFCAMF